MRGDENKFLPLPAKTLGAALEQVGAEFERQRAIRRRRLRRRAWSALAACVIFAALADSSSWSGRLAIGLALVSGAVAAGAAARLWRR